MIAAASDLHERRVLVLAPTPRDAALTRVVLEREGVACVVCPDLPTLCARLEVGAAAVILPEEAIGPERPAALLEILSRQPAWSDLPLLVLARPGADSASVAQAIDLLGNVVVVERPTRMAALISAVKTALRARQRQYQIREHLVARARSESELREADRRKDEFLAILAHELRNPLAPILNSLHVLRLGGDPAAVRGVTDMMERQVHLMVRLIDDLLEISRISRGKIELRRERVELAAVVKSAIETCRPQVELARHQLVLDLPETPVVLEADPVRLSQVFANLLHNAAKYTDPGGTITIAGRADAHEIAVEVRDTGRGIPASLLPRIFELFTQGEHSADRAPGGLGIGLGLARRLVEMHGGTIEAHSDGPGRGSGFVVRLARVSAPAPPRTPTPASSVRFQLAATTRVLVVDDNRDAADSLATVLTMLGADVRTAYDGAGALRALAEWRPTLAVLDIGMAGMDGYEVARRIRARPGLAGVRLVALTGWGQESDRRNSREAGFDHHLTKPVDVAALQALLLTANRTESTTNGS